MMYDTLNPDDEQIATWHRRQAEDTMRSNIHLPLSLAPRLRVEAANRSVSVGRYVSDVLRTALADLPSGPTPTPTPAVAYVTTTSTEKPPPAVDPRQVSLRDLRIIQLQKGRDGESRQPAGAGKVTVLHILRADRVWLKASDCQIPQE